MTKTFVKLPAPLIVLAVLFLPATAFSKSSKYMDVGSYTAVPPGHVDYCFRNRSDCNRRTSSNSRPTMTSKRWQQLKRVNSQVNSSVGFRGDSLQYKKKEHWTQAKRYGDCEDYALKKRRMLMNMGWPASSLLMTVARTAFGQSHAVLTVRTSKGDYILDSQTNAIKLWNRTSLKFISVQSWNHSGKWRKVGKKGRTQSSRSVVSRRATKGLRKGKSFKKRGAKANKWAWTGKRKLRSTTNRRVLNK